METGTVLDARRSGRPRTSEKNIERVRQAFQRSPMNSIRTAARQLDLPRATVHKVLHKNVRLFVYKVQMLQALQPNDMPRQKEFAVNMLQQISEDEAFLKRVCFSDEVTFHVSEKLNKHNVRIWGSENPHATRELQRDSPKVNVWCRIMCNRIIGPFFFHEASIIADVYLDLLTEYVAPQLIEFQPTIIFQQDGASPHWGLHVREFLNETFLNRWIKRDGPIPWSLGLPDITPLGFFLWGYVKDIAYKAKVRDIDDLKQRISNAMTTIDKAMLRRTW